MTLSGTLTRNTAYNALGRLWEAATSLLLTLYILRRHLDWAQWGLWSFVGAFTSYVALADFGIGSGFAKYIAEHAARKEDDEVSAVVSTGVFFYLVLGPLLVLAGWPCVDALIAGFVRLMCTLAPDRAAQFRDLRVLNDVRFLFRGALVLFAASSVATAFTAVQTGLQRMGVTNLIGAAAACVKIAATVAFLEAGLGVRGLLYANAIVTAFFIVATVGAAFRLAPYLRVSPRRVQPATFRRLFAFGWRAQTARLASIIMYQTDKIVAGLWFTSFGPVGVYRFGEDLANKAKQIPLLLLSAVVPAASDLDARGEQERLERLYLLSSKYVAAVAVPVLVFAAAAAGPIVHALLGGTDGLGQAAWVLRLIALSNLAAVICGAGISVALGKGRAGLHMTTGIVSAVANLVLTLLFVYLLGFVGIPLGTMVAMFMGWAWFLYAMRRVVPAPVGALLRSVLLWPLAASLPGAAVCIVCDQLRHGATGVVMNAGLTAICALVFFPSYGVLIRLTPVLDAFDIHFLATRLRLERVPGFRLWAGLRRGHAG